MQVNLAGVQASAQEDLNKKPFIRDDAEDTRCDLSYDDLWRALALSGYGENVDAWRQHFLLSCGAGGGGGGAGSRDPCCRKCRRPLSHHHDTQAKYQFSPLHNFCKRTPVSCSQVQSRLHRSRNHALQAQQRGGLHGLGALGLLAFCDHPTTGEVLCRGCNFPIAQHPNGQDAADAMVNAMGMGGMMAMAHGMSGQGGPQMLGGNHNVELTPEQQQFLQQREQILPVLVADVQQSGGGCPYAVEDLEEFEELSCFKRYPKIWNLYLQTKSREETCGSTKTTYTWTACETCGGKFGEHGSDPAKAQQRAQRGEWDCITPQPCGTTSGQFDSHRARLQQGGGGGGGGFQAIAGAAQHLVAQKALLLNQSTNPPTEICGQCKWAVADHPVGPDPAAETQKAVNNMIGNVFQSVGMGGFAPRQQQPGVQQPQQQQQQPSAQPAAPQSLYQAYPQQQQQQQHTGQQNCAGNDPMVEVEYEEMEMCCGCIPRIVKKKKKMYKSEADAKGANRAGMGWPFTQGAFQ